MDIQKALLDWMEEHGCTRTRLSKDLHIGLSPVCAALNPKNADRLDRYTNFWQKAQAHTGIDLGFPTNKFNGKLSMPKYVENNLRLHGKTVIDERIVKKHGMDKIVDYYEARGIVVTPSQTVDEIGTKYDYLTMDTEKRNK